MLLGCRAPSPGPEQAAARSVERARYEQTRATVGARARALMREHAITGVSLALVDGQEVVWATGWGHADVAAGLPATPRTVYDVGSIAKPVTAVAVLQAVERGELELSATLDTLLPRLDLAGEAEAAITLEDLLTHQAGLPSDWFVHSLSDRPPPWMRIIDELADAEPVAEPRTRTLYSNVGMALAGAALAEAVDIPYEHVVSERLLRPAGMRTAYFEGGPEPQPVHLPVRGQPQGLAAIERAAAYRRGQARSNPLFRMAPAGGLRASVLDLAAFARLILGDGRIDGQRLLDPVSVEAMLTAHNADLAVDLDHRFGYAWFLDAPRLNWAGRVAVHTGRTQFHHAIMILLPDHDLAVAVASNSLGAGATVEILAVETLLAALAERDLYPPESPATIELPREDAATLSAFAEVHGGDYATSTGLTTIELVDGALWSRAQLANLPLHPLDPDSATTERLAPAALGFVERESLHLMTLVSGQPPRQRRAGVRLDPPGPIPEAWRARTGRWQPAPRPGEVSTITDVQLHVADGRLRLEFLSLLEQPPLPVVMVLEPIDDQSVRIAGLARGQGSIITAAEIDGRVELRWSGRRLRPMREPSEP